MYFDSFSFCFKMLSPFKLILFFLHPPFKLAVVKCLTLKVHFYLECYPLTKCRTQIDNELLSNIHTCSCMIKEFIQTLFISRNFTYAVPDWGHVVQSLLLQLYAKFLSHLSWLCIFLDYGLFAAFISTN